MKTVKARHNDEYWVEAFNKGEAESLTYFFELHYKSLCFFANSLIHDLAEAEDIVSDCYVKLWKGEKKIKAVQNIKAFLYISCKNACLNHIKKLKVKSLAQQASLRELEKGENGTFYEVVKTDVLDILATEIELLPEKCRRVFKLLYFEQKKAEEIAAELGISVKTVSNYKSIAIELLKNSMLKKGLSDALLLTIMLFLDRK